MGIYDLQLSPMGTQTSATSAKLAPKKSGVTTNTPLDLNKALNSGGLTMDNQYVITPVDDGKAGGVTGVSSIDDILNQITNTPKVSVPALNYTPPTSADIQAKWNEFLDRAAKDPDIVNYYKNLLDQAKGDTTLAISFLDRDYTMGVRQTKDNLSATLESLGLTSKGEQQTLANNLNQRGIALTQEGPSPATGQHYTTPYAGGGQAGNELSDLNLGQKLRREAEQRSASQGIERMGLTKEKGVTAANQQLQNTSTDIQHAQGQDVQNRAGTYMGLYNAGQSADLLNAQIQQSNAGSGGSASQPLTYNDRLSMWRAKGETGDLPVGWNG